MATSKYYSLIEKLLDDAIAANIYFSITKTKEYCYCIRFKQPWPIKEIECICEEELIAKYMI